MTSYAADDSAAIALRLKEIEKAKQERVAGEAEEPKVGEASVGYPYTMTADYDS
jgi:hypothetical protein